MNDENTPDIEESVQPITRWLRSAHSGDTDALGRLYDAIYPILYRMAAVKPGVSPASTVTPTVVVHELFLKISGSSVMDSKDRHHFFATCSRAMRFIVADFARTALSKKRGGDVAHCQITTALASQPDRAQELLDIDAALDELEEADSRLRELVELKFFGGLTYQEIAELHDRSERSIKRDWIRARALLVARSSGLAAAD